jgi:hypothetical protein
MSSSMRGRCPLLLLLGACDWFGPSMPDGAVPFDPPAVYREWWAKTESCSGQRGSFDRVEWWVIEAHGFECSSGMCAGHWDGNHGIVIARDWVEDPSIVRHEMLHDLLDDGGHPSPPFGKHCGVRPR